MADQSINRLRRATIFFWFFLIYIVAALVWWYLSLEQQNREIYNLKKTQISALQSNNSNVYYNNALDKIKEERRRNTIKYVGEGVIFLLFILVGAAYIYRAVRRQFQLQQQQQNFMMAVTHELKTPISVARLNLETLQRHQLDRERQQSLVNVSLQETLRLDTLINNILISSQLEGDAYQTSKEQLSFSDLTEDSIHQFRERYSFREVISEIQPGIVINGDALLLKLLISNLLENANKYSDKKLPIICKLKTEENEIILQVTDHGVGIPESEMKNIFKKFYRIGNEQTRKTKGTGLGLYICERIATAHNADIRVTNNRLQGSIFTVSFSVKNND